MKKLKNIGALGLAASTLFGVGTTAFATTASAEVSPTLQIIRYCESGGSGGYNALNRSGAAGAYQINAPTWKDYGDHRWSRADKAPHAVQDAVAMKIYSKRGTSPWLSSKGCWQTKLNQYNNSNPTTRVLLLNAYRAPYK